jgi:hypothetical protein
MPFLTLRNKDWLGGDVTITDDGDFLVLQLRDTSPILGYVIVDVSRGTVISGDWATLWDAQQAAERLQKERR